MAAARVVAVLAACIVAVSGDISVSVVCSGARSCEARDGWSQGGAAAWGSFNDTLLTNGWTTLTVFANESATSELQAYAAGYLEAYVTAERIWQHYSNLVGDLFASTNGTVPDAIRTFIETNDAWVLEHAAVSSSDPSWSAVGFAYEQVAGLVDGYSASSFAKQGGSSHALDRFAFLLINMQGDVGDLQTKFSARGGLRAPSGAEPSWLPATWEEALRTETFRTHCSSMVRLTEGYADLMAAHNMWWSYYAMVRVAKTYSFPGRATVSFSSYPATLTSTDDYYVTSHGLVVMETTLVVWNDTLYDRVHPTDALFTWVRAYMANMLATSGRAWVDLFGRLNSGTYNNQWIVVDTKRFSPGAPPPPGTLTILEQLPGFLHAEDMTDHLIRDGYWGSFNRAFFNDTFVLSGGPAMVAKFGPYFTHDGYPRAQIMARDHGKVNDEASMRRFMRYNQWQSDPLSLGSAANQIAAREDLVAPDVPKWQGSRHAGGAIDAKFTTSAMAPRLQTWITAGPTHDDQPVFDWSTVSPELASTPHMGQPTRFDFDWLVYNPMGV